MKLKPIYLAIFLMVSLCANAYKKESVDIVVNQQSRNMVVFTPDKAKKNMPLMIVTHGMNQNPEYQYEHDQLYALIDTAKFVVAYLRSDGNTWDIGGTKDQDFVLQTIDEMASRHGIDRDRVYWSGFSMGSMLMYHCMDKVQDKIAAFAPTSGVQFTEQPWIKCKKAVNLIHCHAYADDVFKYEQYKIHEYVENMAKMNQFTTYIKLDNYRTGGEYTGEKEVWSSDQYGSVVELYAYRDGGHCPAAGNAVEIWNFCKRFRLSDVKELKAPQAQAAAKREGGAIEQPTQFDPNFHIYLCFGQSNMEGNARIEAQDYEGLSPRFLMMSPVNMPTSGRVKGDWYVAYPPLCRDHTGLTPADYFGRTMVERLPENIKVGVINVAVGGCSIDLFDEDKCAAYIAQSPNWLQGFCRDYDNNPYRVLIDMAKKAQKVGVIKGILLHQGCTNNGQQDWPERVNLVYTRMLKELNLKAEDTPLLIGELLSQPKGGVCSGHNSIIAVTPSTIPTAHVVSSADCPGAADGLHFTAEGYRMLGRNYAEVMLQLLGQPTK